jgi:hypothetical protein
VKHARKLEDIALKHYFGFRGLIYGKKTQKKFLNFAKPMTYKTIARMR